MEMEFINGFGSCGFTPEGGFYTTYYAKESLERGSVVYLAQGGINNHVSKTPNGGLMPIGVAYEAVTYTGDYANMVKVVWGGVGVALFDTNRTPAMGDIACVPGTGGITGRVRAYASPNVNDHWGEIGHVTSATPVGTNLYSVHLHFN